MQSLKIKLNKDLDRYKKGDEIVVQLNNYWSKRIKEANLDNCLEIIKENKKKISSKKLEKKRKEVLNNDNSITA